MTSPLQVAPVRLEVQVAVAIVLVFVAGYVIHWLRRAFRQPVPSAPQAVLDIPGDRVQAFDVVQRLFHWAVFVVLGIMTLTGVSIFVPGPFDVLLAPFGIERLDAMIFWHVTFAWALLALIIIHIIWDIGVARGWWNIWIGAEDIKDSWVRTKHFFGLSSEYKRIPKYDIFMKTFHWGLTLSLVVLGITGLFFWNPYALFPDIDYGTEYFFRLLHDIFAVLLVGLIIGHVYFAVIPHNWPILKAMVTGTMSKDDYAGHFDPTRWPVARRVEAEETQPSPSPGGG